MALPSPSSSPLIPADLFSDKLCDDDVALVFADSNNYKQLLTEYDAVGLAHMAGWVGKQAQVLMLPPQDIKRTCLVGLGAESHHDYSFSAKVVKKLNPDNNYYIAHADKYDSQFLYDFALGWGLEQYKEGNYKSSQAEKQATLALPEGVGKKQLMAELHAVFLTRHLINTPANDMNPETLHKVAESLAKKHSADFKAIVGDDLLKENFPLIHAVGRASQYQPRLLEFSHAPKGAKLSVTLVGKGVCFDSGGLDIKPSSGMLLMKKDMGGAANVLGLAQLIMETGLPIRLRVLVAAVENAISANAFRPMDILPSRSGISVEVGNTDAEGRLILADALTYACEDGLPDVLIDFATLTGAARVAVGTEVAAMFANDKDTASALSDASNLSGDFLWELPLHRPYRRLLDSSMADISSTGGSGYAGAITAALFLQEFVPAESNWVHFDLMGWNVKSRPAHPIGGEAMGLRATYHYLKTKVKG